MKEKIKIAIGSIAMALYFWSMRVMFLIVTGG